MCRCENRPQAMPDMPMPRTMKDGIVLNVWKVM